MNAPEAVFSVEPVVHRALGPLRRLRVGDFVDLRLTPQEASTLALALHAVREGRSAERQLFLSPIASDGHFNGIVGPDGLTITCVQGQQQADVWLDWGSVESLALALAA
ncbi:hypothetical protein [Plasticicumulans acidivorans]|uniref:Uncharacterized protein n=1 Tax=Plasticicumulans acidivorans TaxID=886464 RepID=A0A317MRW3_9GAMM|nr:hypothetical protein [Plasticicumulans acidivorans]PWV58620.1 hypothetical protein C7443_11548 [Plasticicumulans acidivorans]